VSVVGWFWICAAIALLGLAYLVVHGRAVWRKVRLLLAEVDAAVTRAEEASRPGAGPGGQPGAPGAA
jgi:hypothetical protein